RSAKRVSTIAPPIAEPQLRPNSPPIRRPASTHTSTKAAITTALTRLLCAIWWYMGPLRGDGRVLEHRGAGGQHGPARPDRSPDQAVGECRVLLRVVLVVEGPHGRVELVEHALGR